MHNEPLNKRDAIRLLAALSLCVVAAGAFYIRENALPALSKPYASISYKPIISNDLDDAIDFAPEITVREVTVNLLDPPAVVLESVMPELSPESKEQAPDVDIQIDVVTRQRDGALKVLIYHTHTEEAYEQTAQYAYVSHGEYHTTNNDRNVVRVGAELARILTEQYGMIVTHDTTDHEPPNYDTAYTRSLRTIAGYMERGDTFDLYIDLHRDSYARKHAENYVVIGDVKVARIMMLVGRGENYEQKPNWQENLALAQSLTERLNAIADTLCDKVTMSGANRYNQHISTHALLIEIGNNRNTLEEALAAAPYLAEAIDIVMGE